MKYKPRREGAPSKFKTYFFRCLLYLGVLVLLLIPTYAAVAAYTLQKNAPVDTVQTVYDEMLLTGPNGSSITASDTKNSALFAIFTTLCESGAEVVSLPETHLAGHYVISMQNKDVNDRFDFYFLPEQDTCYYTTPDAKIIRSRAEQVTEFLNSSFAFELYKAATIPVLTTAATDEVIPASVSWKYRTANGQFTQHTYAATTNQTHIYPIANDIAFYFSVQPSSYDIVIYREGEEPYHVTSNAISLPLVDDELLDVEIRAIFDADASSDYFGELFYSFRMQVVEAAHFSLNANTLQLGDILLLTCENVKNAEKLQISATPALTASPILFQRGEYVYAAIPLTIAGDYTLRVTYGTVSATFSPCVTDTTGATAPDTADLNGDWITLLAGKLPELIGKHGATSDSSLTPHGALTRPTGEKIFGFGDRFNLESAVFNAPALSFDLYHTTGTVNALAAGRVLLTASDLHLGKYVIVDHGCGLYTWYAGLSEVRVSAGDILAVGDVVGLPSTTLHREQSALIMATLGKAAVSVDLLCGAPVALPE